MAINYVGDVPAYVTLPPTLIILWIVVSTWGRRTYPASFRPKEPSPHSTYERVSVKEMDEPIRVYRDE